MDDFLRSPVLPGSDTKKHEHRRMLLVLGLVLILAVIAFLVFIFSKGDLGQFDFTHNKSSEKSVIEQLKESTVKLTEQEKIDTSLDLLRSSKKISEEEKSAMIEQLRKK